MKQLSKITLLVLLTMVIVLGTFTSGQAAYLTQITGCLVESSTTSTPWTYGATVTLYEVGSGTLTQLNSTNTDNFTTCFTFTFTAAVSNRTLMIEIDYTPAPGKSDPDTDQLIILDDNTQTSPYNLGDISANTTPNAVTLSQMEASPAASPWALFAVLAMALGLAGGAFTIVRRRKSA